jgi:crotonobetainyl-CoA:carnitine CoA-transferase CaiB-like acyl-CoA transferase
VFSPIHDPIEETKLSRASLAELIELAGLPAHLVEDVQISGTDPVFPTPYKVAGPGAASIAASGLAAAHLWSIKTGTRQQVQVDAYHACAAMRSNQYLKIDGQQPPRPRDEVTGFYRLRDGGWIYLHCNFPNLRDANLRALGATPQRDAAAAAVARWDGLAAEEAIFAAGGCGALVRSEEQWLALPAAAAAASAPVLEIVKIGEAPPEALPVGEQPLSGIRVLDLTRVLAGPTCGRTLAEHGADVLRISGRGMADSGMFDLDTGLGKLSAYLDLRDPAGVETLRGLIRSGDVFSQAYRPGSLAARGFSPEALAQMRPGIVYVTLSAWGHLGPWSDRRGYDTVVQAANGMAYRPEGEQPAFMPVSEQDYIAGYLMAFGAMVALGRRAREGGSWMVRVSLAGTGHWIRQHGLLDLSAPGMQPAGISDAQIESFTMESASPVGRLSHLAPAAHLSATPGRWSRPAVELGTHQPAWPPRG